MEQQQYCPFCGVELVLPPQFANPIPQCPVCNYVAWNAPTPVVLTLVYHGDKILLGRSPHFAPGAFALLAGHVEQGESAEEAARREVKEESGIDCEITHFTGSFALTSRRQLCLTFAARYLAGEAKADDDVEEVRWFGPADQLPVRGSIALDVIRRWREGLGTAIQPLKMD